MYEIEYTADRTLRRQAWQLLRQKTLLSPAGIFGILGPVFLAAQGGFAELQRTVNERVRDAQPLDETLWRSLITPRPGLVWAASYSAADAWKRRMSMRLALGGTAALLIVLLLMPGGPLVKGIAAAVVLALIIGQASPRRREKATVQGGRPGWFDESARPV